MLFDKFLAHPSETFGSSYEWLVIGSYSISFGIAIDNLASVMLLVVTLVSALVHLFSIGYMKDDVRYTRYFAYLGLFSFSMLGIVRETFLTHLKVKAYVMDPRLEFLFMSDVTERARAGFRAAGMLGPMHGVRTYVELNRFMEGTHDPKAPEGTRPSPHRTPEDGSGDGEGGA